MPPLSHCFACALATLGFALPIVFAQNTLPKDPAQICADLCASCHGVNLTGNAGPNLLDAYWNHGGDDGSILRSIRDGYPESNMPPFGAAFSETELKALVGYLRAQGEAFAAGRIRLPPPPKDRTIESQQHAFRLETWISDLDTPWGIAFLPGDRILVTERPGRLRVIDQGKLQPNPIEGTPSVFLHQDGGLLDVIAHPDYARNGWIYLAYSEEGKVKDTSMTVVVRGRIHDGRWIDQQDVFRAPPRYYYPGYIHYGCRFLFDSEGHLFFTIGDRGQLADAQDLASPCGKIHRALADGRAPADNPFAQRPGAWPTIWSLGNRHPQGLAFHPETGKLWASEHGPNRGDELNRIEPGRNYGWPVISYGTERRVKIEGTSKEGMEQPIVHWSESLAVGAIEFYTGHVFPGWKNQLLVAGLGGVQLRRLKTEGDRVLEQEILFKDEGRVRDVVTGPDGLIYIAFNSPGRIARLLPVKKTP